MISDWPVYRDDWHFPAQETELSHAKDLVRGMRNLRTDMDVPPSRKAKLFVTSTKQDIREVFERIRPCYLGLAGATEVLVQEGNIGIPEDAVSFVIPDAIIYVPLEDLVDKAKEIERLNKERDRLSKELARSKGMLSNEKFLSKAPAEKVAEEKEKQKKYESMMADVEARLAAMK